MVQALTKLTLAEFLQLPETKPPSKYLHGQIIQKAMPQGKHSTIPGELVPTINAVVKSNRIARAFPELRCTFGGRSTSIAPDWTIEILSPDQSQTKVTKNILHCLKYETQMGWLIDPVERTVFVYRPNQQIEVFDHPDAIIPVPSFASEVHLTVGNLFAWLLE